MRGKGQGISASMRVESFTPVNADLLNRLKGIRVHLNPLFEYRSSSSDFYLKSPLSAQQIQTIETIQEIGSEIHAEIKRVYDAMYQYSLDELMQHQHEAHIARQNISKRIDTLGREVRLLGEARWQMLHDAPDDPKTHAHEKLWHAKYQKLQKAEKRLREINQELVSREERTKKYSGIAFAQSAEHVLTQLISFGTGTESVRIEADDDLIRKAHQAMQYIPSQWISRMQKYPLKIQRLKEISEREAHAVYSKDAIELHDHLWDVGKRIRWRTIDSRSAQVTLLHEMVHHAERSNPNLFYLGSAYRDYRLFQKDRFDYDLQSIYTSDHTEIFTKGIECLFGRSEDPRDLLFKDPNYTNFLLGSLLALEQYEA